MVHSTISSPLVITPHGDYDKQVIRHLDEALASGFIKQDKYRDLYINLQWVLPFQQEQFMVHLNDQIRDASPTLISNRYPNVRPSAASFTTETAKTVHVTDDSDLYNTDNWWNDKFNSSVPIPTSSPSVPKQIIPPTSAPTSVPAAFHCCAHSPIELPDAPEARRIADSPSDQHARRVTTHQSASSDSLNQHHRKILSSRKVTIGNHTIYLPPTMSTQSSAAEKVQSRSEPPAFKSQPNIPISQSEFENQVADNKIKSQTIPAIRSAQYNQNPLHSTTLLSAPLRSVTTTTTTSTTSTPISSAPAMALISSAPVMATISSAPYKQDPLRSTSTQSEIKPAIADYVVESAAATYKHIIQVSNFEFPVQSIIQDSGFQSPVQSNIQDSCFQFSVSSISRYSSISEYPFISEYPLIIVTTPAIEPEPPPDLWITFLCMVSLFGIQYSLRTSLWGSNSVSTSFLESSCAHELISHFLSFAQTVRSHRRTCLTQCFYPLE
jgi:hypothetical protein